MEVRKKPQFQITDIPSTISGVELSYRDIEKLSYGESSGLLKNLKFGEGELRDGKIYLSRDEKGHLEINYMFLIPKELIFKQIDKYMISKSDKQRLLNHEIAGPFLLGGQHVFLQADHEINRVVIKSGYAINVPKKIAGYSLTAEDMNALANGKKLESRLLYFGGKYYTANIGMTEDKQGLTFDSLFDQNHLSKDERKRLEKTLNKPSVSVPPLELLSGLKTSGALKKKEFAKYLLNPADGEHPIEGGLSKQQEIFRDAVDHYDVDMLVHQKKSGFIPDRHDIDYIRDNINLDIEEKKVIGTALEINHKEVTYDGYNRPDQVLHTRQSTKVQRPERIENTEKNHFQNPDASEHFNPARKDPQKSSDPAFAQKVSNMVTEAFSNM